MREQAEAVDATDRYIGGRLLACRRLQGLALDEVALEAAVNPSDLAAIEAGQGKVYISTLWRLCRALDVEVGDFLPPPIIVGRT